MEKINTIFMLIRTLEKYRPYLFYTYYVNVIQKDRFLSELYLQIERNIRLALRIELKKIYIRGHELSNKNKFTIPIRNRLGLLVESEVVKKMVSQKNIYEIRMNSEFEKNRILFFPYQSDALVFTFGFTKRKYEKDLTQILIQQSQDIKDFIDIHGDRLELITKEFSK